jgi:hypothetical protein
MASRVVRRGLGCRAEGASRAASPAAYGVEPDERAELVGHHRDAADPPVGQGQDVDDPEVDAPTGRRDGAGTRRQRADLPATHAEADGHLVAGLADVEDLPLQPVEGGLHGDRPVHEVLDGENRAVHGHLVGVELPEPVGCLGPSRDGCGPQREQPSTSNGIAFLLSWCTSDPRTSRARRAPRES